MTNISTPLVLSGNSNFRLVDDGFYAGAQPVLPTGIEALALLGVDTVIDLQSQEVTQEKAACDSNGIIFHSIPLPGVELFHELPMDKVDEVVDLIEECIQAKRPVFIHCKHGADRTGAIVGCYRIDHGATVGEALTEMKQYHNSWLEWGMRDSVSDFYERRIKK